MQAALAGFDWLATAVAIAREYAEHFAYWLVGELVGGLGRSDYELEELTSPRFYNFETDRVFLRISSRLAGAMRSSTAPEALAEVVVERHTSRPGFVSFYSADMGEWAAKPFDEWDHNELGTLLLAWMRTFDHDHGQVEDKIREEMSCNGIIAGAVKIDVDRAVAALRTADLGG